MNITITNDKMIVKSKFSHAFIRRAHGLEGKYDSRIKCWEFPLKNEPLVRKALLESYGEDGTQHATVDFDIVLEEYMGRFDRELAIGDVIIAERPARDVNVVMKKNTLVVKGGFFPKGGTQGAGVVTYEKGTVVRVKKFPMELFLDMPNKKGISIVNEDTDPLEQSSLRRRVEALEEKIDEITKKDK